MYSDDDVSVSGSEEDHEEGGGNYEQLEDTSDISGDDMDAVAAETTGAAAAAAAAAASGGLTASGTTKALTNALMTGEVSTQTALLRLELSELLSELAAARQPLKVAAVAASLTALQDALQSLPTGDVSAAAAAAVAASAGGPAAALAGVISSMGLDAQAVQLALAPPTAVQLVGSWADGTAVDLPGATVDVAVQLPSSCCHHKDHLNYRYHAKRALYLTQLSHHLAAHTAFRGAQQTVTALQGDPYRPVLLLHLDGPALANLLQQHPLPKVAAAAPTAAAAVFGSAGLVLRLLPCAGLDVFELAKLAPSRNNIRWFTAASAGNSSSSMVQTTQQQDGDGQELLPTPHYNTAVLQDVLLLTNSSKQQQAALAGGARYVEALMLLKVWAQQHGLAATGVLPPAAYACDSLQQQVAGATQPPLSSPAAAAVQADGFSGHVLAALLTAAVQKADAAAAAMSPLQLFRTALQLLADKQQWVKGGGVSLVRDSSVPTELQQHHNQQQLAAHAVEGKVSKGHAKLVQKLQQQLHMLPAPPDAAGVFRKAFQVTFLDSSGQLNLAANISNTMMQMAQAAAQQSLAVLNRPDLEPDVVFGAVFKSGQGLTKLFHYYWTVELPGTLSASSNKQQQQQPGDQHSMRLAELEVEGLVRAALGSRARLVKAVRRTPVLQAAAADAPADREQHQTDQQQQRKKAKHSHKQPRPAIGDVGGNSSSVCVPRRMVIAAAVDAVSVLRLVDVGPAADDAAAAAKFRKMWGDKSELRRFQDGKICEAVVWEGVPTGQRHKIPDLAVAYILSRHLPAGTVITATATALDPLLYASSSTDAASTLDNVQWAAASTATAGAASADSSSVAASIGASNSSSAAAAGETAASRAADAALDALTKQLRALNDLALKVIGVQPLSSISRHTCCFYPEPHPLAEGSGARAYTSGTKVPRVLEPITVMVQLESTAKMPVHPEAFAKTKAALGVQLASNLAAASGAHVTATEEALEVLWQGFAFKLMLYLDREAAVMALPSSINGSSNPGSGSSSSTSGHQSLPVLLSQHHGLVSELSAAHAAYGPTVRLAKRWLGAHLLLGVQVCEEAVELLVGAAFQGPSTAPPPASRISGFLSFLHLLSSQPWAAAPLVIDQAGQVTQEARRALQAHFDALRESGSAPAMFLATPYDLYTSRWTSQQPSSLVLAHLVSLARTAYQALSQLLLLGADSPTVQQQFAALQLDQHLLAASTQSDTASGGTKRSKKHPQHLANGAAVDGSEKHKHLLQQLEARALGRTWRMLCAPVLTGFDALLLLRKEGLPFAERADPLAVQQLKALVGQQQRQQRRLAGVQKQQQPGGVMQLLLADSRGGVLCTAPKNARAILRNVPEQVLLSKPADKLRSELLVGFDPVQHYLSLLTQRYGHLAQFCADSSCCFPAIGIKWLPAAFLPAPLRPSQAHAMMDVCATAAAGVGKAAGKGKQGSQGFSSRGLVVPNLPQVLCEAAQMGLGLVEEVLLL